MDYVKEAKALGFTDAAFISAGIITFCLPVRPRAEPSKK